MRLAELTAEARALAAECPLFCGLPAEEADRWLADPRCVRGSFPRGAVIYEPRRFQRSLGLLLAGRVQVGVGALVAGTVEPGELFGAAALFSPEPVYPATLTARAACDVLFFPQALAEERLAASPAAARRYMAYLSAHIRFLSGKLADLTAGSAERKLAQYLLERAQGETAVLDCSATTLARRLNVSRASLYRSFDALETAGVAERTRQVVRILDPEALAQI